MYCARNVRSEDRVRSSTVYHIHSAPISMMTLLISLVHRSLITAGSLTYITSQIWLTNLHWQKTKNRPVAVVSLELSFQAYRAFAVHVVGYWSAAKTLEGSPNHTMYYA